LQTIGELPHSDWGREEEGGGRRRERRRREEEEEEERRRRTRRERHFPTLKISDGRGDTWICAI